MSTNTIVFNGYQFATQQEKQLVSRVEKLKQRQIYPKITAIAFKEDQTGLLYSRLKKEAAERVGIAYEIERFSIPQPLKPVLAKLGELNHDNQVTGIIVQKPLKRQWIEVKNNLDESMKRSIKHTKKDFESWWQQLVTTIDLNKDVDGLHPKTLQSIKAGMWERQHHVLPATCRAVLMILDQAEEKTNQTKKEIKNSQILVIGQSDILGRPLYYQLKNQGRKVRLFGSQAFKKRLETGQKLLDADVIVTATGVNKLITADLVKSGVIIIDAGEPSPDADFNNLKAKASFITPVPGGVGPATVVSLLANSLDLLEAKKFNHKSS